MQSRGMDLCYQFVRSAVPGKQALRGKRSERGKEGKPRRVCYLAGCFQVAVWWDSSPGGRWEHEAGHAAGGGRENLPCAVLSHW